MRGYHGHNVQVRSIGRHTIDQDLTLPGHTSANLKISESEGISANGIARRRIASRRGALWHNARHQADECQRVAPVERQLRHGSLFHHLPQRVRFRLEQRRLAGHLDSLGLRSNWQRDIHSQPAFDLHQDWLAHKLLEAGLFSLQLVAAGQDIHERVVAGRVGFYAALLSGIQIRQCDYRVGNGSSTCIRNRSGDGAIDVLAPARRRRERQNDNRH